MVITLKEKLTKIVKSVLKVVHYDFVGIELIHGRKMLIRVYIDKQCEKVTIEDCVIVSRKIGFLLDKGDFVPVSYVLEVSSPGLDRPLFSYAHFVKFIGSEVYLILYSMLYGRRRWRGFIKTVNDDQSVVLTVNGRDVNIMLSNVQKANLVPHF